MLPNISIGIPTYNGSKYISTAIESALNQTISPLDIIVSDDYSADDTLNKINKYNNLIDIYAHDKNIGIANNYLFLIKKAKGDFIILLSQDDALHHRFIEKTIKYLKRFTFVYTGRFECNDRMEPLGYSGFSYLKNRHIERGKAFPDFLGGCGFTMSGAVWDREWLLSLPLLPKEAEFCFDWYAAILASISCKIIKIVSPLVYYRFHDSNSSHSNPERWRKNAVAMLKFLSSIDSLGKTNQQSIRLELEQMDMRFCKNKANNKNILLQLTRQIMSYLLIKIYDHPKFLK